MSKYTTELRFICEQVAGNTESKGYSDVNSIVKEAAPLIFNFDYPIFDENYRIPLETKILKHFYTREIGFETFGLWKLKLDTKLNEIMPYYNQLYKSELLEFNPLWDTDLTTQHKRDNNGTQNSTAESNAKATAESKQDTTTNTNETTQGGEETQRNITHTINQKSQNAYSDTPQGGISNTGIPLPNPSYLTDYREILDTGNNSDSDIYKGNTAGKREINDTANTQANSESNTDVNSSSSTAVSNLEEYIQTIVGKRSGQSYSQMLNEFRNTFLNIDMQVINELDELFFGLW